MRSILSFRKGYFLIAISVLFFAACKPAPNANPTDGDDNGGYASDASRIEWVNNDVISIADAAGLIYNGAYMRTTHNTISGCCLVGVDTPVNQEHTLTIQFGDQDCVCLDGRTRRGSIIVKYNGRYEDTAQAHTITFSNYYVNGNEVSGTINTIRVDTFVTGDWYYKVVEDLTLNMSPDPLKSQLIVWNGTMMRKWISGYATNTRSDDVFSVSGTGNLTRPNGHQFSFNISAPLQIAMGCDFTEAGVVNVSGYTGDRVLNYGAGNCDNLAQLNIGVNVSTITLTK